MATPTLTPASVVSVSRLSATGNTALVTSTLAYGIYTSEAFISGAVDQVAYTYQKLGGEILDIEIMNAQVYNAYEEATLEYSYLVNIHQAKNMLSNVLGGTTGSFDEDGQLIAGDSLEDINVNLRFPRFDFAYARRTAEGVSAENGMGSAQVYSASFDLAADVQDYDLQSTIYSASIDADNTDFPYYNKVGKNKITITKVYYKTPAANWRFYGYYGGLNTVGNLGTYGQYADDSTFQVIPVWQNKAQAIAYEDSIYTRNSHWSYELNNNKVRIFPIPPASGYPAKLWVDFSAGGVDTWEEQEDRREGVQGINNMNTLPFENIPYANINAIGKQWIRRFALALSKEMLGYVRSKFASIPIPGNDVSMNGTDLISQGKEEQTALRDELKTVLDELTYGQLMEGDATAVENSNKIQQNVPMLIYSG
jgi:hypothetical protein|tara:strand:+ start:570 stop:1838 length:1269 start_codon:yes stop_codon:yes gene_type:complete